MASYYTAPLPLVGLGGVIPQLQADYADIQQKNQDKLNDVNFKKFDRVTALEKSVKIMPWHIHIPKVIGILDQLRAQDPDADGDKIELSDFTVSLDTISLKGTVKNLALVHGTPKLKGLIDKFQELDFITDMRILDYRDIGGRFEFTLQANVVIDGSK
jgi:hypothetical protein